MWPEVSALEGGTTGKRNHMDQGKEQRKNRTEGEERKTEVLPEQEALGGPDRMAEEVATSPGKRTPGDLAEEGKNPGKPSRGERRWKKKKKQEAHCVRGRLKGPGGDRKETRKPSVGKQSGKEGAAGAGAFAPGRHRVEPGTTMKEEPGG